MEEFEIKKSHLDKLNSKLGLLSLFDRDSINYAKTIRYINYERKLKKLQVELVDYSVICVKPH